MIGPYRIAIDQEWTLEDLSQFSRVFNQVYSLIYSVTAPAELDNALLLDDLEYVYQAFPWRGGYSAVNFYNSLYYRIPPNHRPKIISISYASPGWMELFLFLTAAKIIASLVKTFRTMTEDLAAMYRAIYTTLHERKLMQLSARQTELRLTEDNLRIISQYKEELATLMGFELQRQIDLLTKNELASLKILLSLYRRIRTLANYAKKEKVYFLGTGEDDGS